MTHMRLSHRSALSLVLLVALIQRTAVAGERVVMKCTLSGRAGDSLTFLAADRATKYIVTFVTPAPKMTVVVVSMDAKANLVTKRYESRDGELLPIPVLLGDIRKVTVEFVGRGTFEVEVAEDTGR